MGFFSLSLPDISLIVYRNTKDFRILILYPATLMNSFIRSHSFWLLHGFLMAAFFLCSHMLFPQCVCVHRDCERRGEEKRDRETEREREEARSLMFLLIRTLILS